jgi:hypothetical protein
MLKKVVVVDAYKIRRATKEMTDSDFKEMLGLIEKLQT